MREPYRIDRVPRTESIKTIGQNAIESTACEPRRIVNLVLEVRNGDVVNGGACIIY